MRHLLRKQIILIVIACIFLNFHASAQFKQLNREGHDNMPYYFGLSISYNNATLHPSKNPRFLENDSILSVEPGAKGGISLGLQATFRINKRFEFRANPQLIVGGAKFFTYTLKNPLPTEADTVIQNLPSTIVSFPLQIKFNSDRIDNFRVYMLGGIKYDLDLASNSSARNAENFVKLKKGDFGLEAGLGFNFYLPFVTVSPELKISYGLTNIHSRDPNLKYSSVLDKLQSRMIVFTINLED